MVTRHFYNRIQGETYGIIYTWGDYAHKLVGLVMSRHKNASRIISINDIYTSDYSIKDSERLFRKSSKPVCKVFMKVDNYFPAINEVNAIFSKPESKVHSNHS